MTPVSSYHQLHQPCVQVAAEIIHSIWKIYFITYATRLAVSGLKLESSFAPSGKVD